MGNRYGFIGDKLWNIWDKSHELSREISPYFPVYVDLLGINMAHGSSWDNWKIGGSILFRWIYRDFIYNH